MRLKNVCLLLPLAALASCSRYESGGNEAAAPVSAEEVLASGDSVSFSSDIADIRSASRKVVRTAGIRCRVTDVLQATSAMEAVVRHAGGVVQQSDLSNDNFSSQTIYYKPDSLKSVQVYTPTAFLTLRVPGRSLDSVLQAIPPLAEFIESRKLAQNDVTLSYLSNSLRNKVSNTNAKAMELARKSGGAIDAGQYDESRQLQGINRSLENLKLLDDANYATITVEFYQPERIVTRIVPDPEYFSRPGFGEQLAQAGYRGWTAIKAFFIVAISIWPLWIVVLMAFVVYRAIAGKRKPLSGF